MNRKISGTIFAAACTSVVVALFVCGAASAQMGHGGYASGPSPSPSGYPTSGTVGQMPTNGSALSAAEFAKEAAEGGLVEVKLGQLAQDRGSSDAVKEFGKRMVADHTQAIQLLKTIASQKDMNLPTDLNKRDQKTYDKLSEMSGEAFDKAYMKQMVRDDQDHISMFQQEASYGQDTNFKDFASRLLPTLQEHLKMAKETSKTVASEKGEARKSASN
jgi:putative membrane protein